jgi:hypothetical protein
MLIVGTPRQPSTPLLVADPALYSFTFFVLVAFHLVPIPILHAKYQLYLH